MLCGARLAILQFDSNRKTTLCGARLAILQFDSYRKTTLYGARLAILQFGSYRKNYFVRCQAWNSGSLGYLVKYITPGCLRLQNGTPGIIWLLEESCMH